MWGGAEEIYIAYVDHIDYTEKEFYTLISQRPILYKKLLELLYEFSNMNLEVVIPDNFLLNATKSLARGLLERRLNFKMAYYGIRSIAFEFFAARENITVCHNDLNYSNILIDFIEDVYIIDYDRGTCSSKFIYRDILYFLLRSDMISEWTWQYNFFADYYLRGESQQCKRRKFQNNIYWTCIRLSMLYIYEREDSYLFKNFNQLIDKKQAKIWLDTLWERIENIRKVRSDCSERKAG